MVKLRAVSRVLVGVVGVGTLLSGCGDGGGTIPIDAGRMDVPSGTGGRAIMPDAAGSGGAAGSGSGGATPDAGGPIGIQLTVSSAVVTVREGEMQTFMVGLASPARSQLSVNVVTSDNTVAMVQQDTVTFESGEMGPKSVTVVAPQDPDLTPDNANVTLSGDGVRSAMVRVAVTDNDVQQIAVSPTPQTTVTEGGTGRLDVNLRYQPAAPVTLTVTSGNPAKLTVSTATLTFDGDNYNTPQAVTLTSIRDLDLVSDTVAVTVSAGATGDPVAVKVDVRITDVDALNIQATPAALTLTEGAAARTLMVTLTRAPAAPVVVSVVSRAPGKVGATPAMLTFTPADFATPQLVSVTALQDDDDDRDEDTTLDMSAPGAEAPLPVPVHVIDDDDQAIQVSSATLTIVEGAPAMMLGVRLALNPGGAAPVSISVNSSKVEISPSTLIFNSTNYRQFQQVMVQGLEDEDLVNDTVTLTLISAAAEGSRSVVVTITDNDVQGILLVNTTEPLNMLEGRPGAPSSATIGVRLAYRPANTVTMSITSSEGTVANPKLGITPTTLIFEPQEYALPRFLVLTANDESDLIGDEVNVTFSGNGVPSKNLTVQIADSDVQGITVTDNGTPRAPLSSVLLAERTGDDCTAALPAGGPVSRDIRVALNFAPEAPVTLNLSTSANAKFTLSATSVTIDTANNPTPAVVTVTRVADCDTRSETGTITIVRDASLSSSLNVMVTDEDVMQLLVEPVSPNATVNMGVVSATVSENAMQVAPTPGTAQFRVRLSKDAVPPVMASLIPSSSGVVTIMPTSGAATRAGFLVTVAGLSDDNLVPDGVSIRVTVPISGVADQFVSVTEIDDDAQGIIVVAEASPGVPQPTPGPLMLVEGGDDIAPIDSASGAPASFTVRLTQQPPTATNVNVIVPASLTSSFQVSADNVIFASSIELTFSSANFTMPRRVWVKAIADENLENERALISVANPSFANNETVEARAIEVDRQQIVVSTAAVALNEAFGMGVCSGGSAPAVNCPQVVNVSLRFPPAGLGSETIILSEASNAFGISTVSMTFNNTRDVPGGWNIPQPLNVTPVIDEDARSQVASVTLRSDLQPTTPEGVAALDVVIPVTVTDQNMQLMVFTGLTTGAVRIVEEASGMVGLRLNADPITPVTVTCTSSNPAKVTVTGGPFAFDPGLSSGAGTWEENRIIGLNVLADSDLTDDDVTISCTTTDGTPVVPALSFTVRAVDNDRSLTVAPTAGGDVDATGGSTGITDCRSGDNAGCVQNYTVDTPVMLTATPETADWVFGGWGGTDGCAPANPALTTTTVTMSTNKSCTATFRPILAVTTVGDGTVLGTPNVGSGGIMTPANATFSDNFALNATVTFTVHPAAGSTFTSWSGAGCPTTGVEPFTAVMNGPHHCTATFTVNP